MEYIFKTNALSKRYGHYNALDNLTMHVPKGAIYGFIGKNGAGKTTLIRLLCGLQQPSSGSFMLYGKDSNERKFAKVRRRIGAVVETPSIYLDMSAENNLKQQYQILGLPTYEGIDEILELVGLKDTKHKKAKNFSLGMRQRLGIAIALVGNPDFLVLDEPMNGLDPQGIIEMRELMLKLNQEQQITILISSHILDELSKIATHYGFINNGHLVKEISNTQLQNACRKCECMEVSDTKALACVLDKMGIEYKIISNTKAEVYNKINISTLCKELDNMNCELVSIKEYGENLESYFINLIGGGNYA